MAILVYYSFGSNYLRASVWLILPYIFTRFHSASDYLSSLPHNCRWTRCTGLAAKRESEDSRQLVITLANNAY